MAVLEDTITISARRRVSADAAETFAFLAAPATHRQLQVHGIASLSVSGEDSLSGGAIVLRGPLGLRRTIRTRIALRQSPTRLAATAHAESGTAAYVSWTLREQHDGTTIVELAAMLSPIAGRDRLLLALGGRPWVRHLFTATLRRLAAELEDAPRRMANSADPAGGFRRRFPLSRELAPFDPA
jgi:Polyketide cyclase / dehydrase and lipid transport